MEYRPDHAKMLLNFMKYHQGTGDIVIKNRRFGDDVYWTAVATDGSKWCWACEDYPSAESRKEFHHYMEVC